MSWGDGEGSEGPASLLVALPARDPSPERQAGVFICSVLFLVLYLVGEEKLEILTI